MAAEANVGVAGDFFLHEGALRGSLSAKLCGVEPKAYLLWATHAALASPGTVTLPHALLSA